LVNSLYAVYERAESGFQERYFDMLKAGGSKRYGELLAPFGLDAKDPDFWAMGLSVIEGLIDELESGEGTTASGRERQIITGRLPGEGTSPPVDAPG